MAGFAQGIAKNVVGYLVKGCAERNSARMTPQGDWSVIAMKGSR